MIRTLDFLITSYKSMYEEVRFNEQWKEKTEWDEWNYA